MKIYWIICCMALIPFGIKAQEAASEPVSESIVDRINRPEQGKGSVKVLQDEAIGKKIGRPGRKNQELKLSSADCQYVQMLGWRIQVFSGNNLRVSKNEAFGKEAEIKSAFPEVSTYVKYNAPFWRLRVGDFQTYQSAQNMLVQLRHAFPAFGREMSIVKEKIQVKVQ